MHAVIPAAGFSRRMGRPKLLLPVGGSTVVRRLIDTLVAAGVNETWVLAREEDAPLRAALAGTPAHVLCTPAATDDMRSSVQLLLAEIDRLRAPGPHDAWLLVPADHPLISVHTVRALAQAWREQTSGIVVPTHAGRRGHPTLFGWPLARQVADIPAGMGLNWLVRQFAADVRELSVDDPGAVEDLDTPDDWARAVQRLEATGENTTAE